MLKAILELTACSLQFRIYSRHVAYSYEFLFLLCAFEHGMVISSTILVLLCGLPLFHPVEGVGI